MKRNKDHLSLVDNSKEISVWRKIWRFVFRATILVALLFLLKEGMLYFRIAEIQVEGAADIPAREVINAAGIEKGMSIILLREHVIAERLEEKLPQVHRVEISRELPDKVIITINERVPAASVLTADGYWAIDRDTVAYAYMSEPLKGYPVVIGVGGETVVSGSPLGCPVRSEALKRYFSVQGDDLPFIVEKINLSESFNLVVYTVDGVEIWLGDGESIDKKLRLVEQSLPFIDVGPGLCLDLRSGNRMVVEGGAVTGLKGVEP